MKYNFETFKALYNQFVNHYNSHESGLTAFAQITTVRTGIERRQTDLDKSIQGFINQLEDQLESRLFNVCSGGRNIGHEPDPKDRDKQGELIKQKDQVINQINREVKSRIFTDEMQQQTTEALKNLHEMAGEPETVGESLIYVNEIIRLGRKLKEIRYHMDAILSITGKIVDMGYPDKIPTYEKLTPEEQKQTIIKVGNPDMIDSEIEMPKGFYTSAKDLIKEYPHWTQEGIYDELIERHWPDEVNKPSFATIRRRLKNSKLW